MTLTAKHLSRLSIKALEELKPTMDSKYHYILDRIIETRKKNIKQRGFSADTAKKAGIKGSKKRWEKENI